MPAMTEAARSFSAKPRVTATVPPSARTISLERLTDSRKAALIPATKSKKRVKELTWLICRRRSVKRRPSPSKKRDSSRLIAQVAKSTTAAVSRLPTRKNSMIFVASSTVDLRRQDQIRCLRRKKRISGCV